VTTGTTSGTVYVREGQIHHAQTEEAQGSVALFEMLRWKDGRFEMLPYQDVGINTLDQPWEHLLLEAMRLRDETGSDQVALVVPGDMPETARDTTSKPGLDRDIDDVFDELEQIAQQVQLEEAEQEGAAEVSPKPVRVLIVDDSTFFARQLKNLMESGDSIEVVGLAKNGQEALEFLDSGTPVDLITLDIQMPVMQGDTALKHIMIRSPVPVLMISTLQSQSLNKIFEFLQVGAVDFVPKPEAHEDVTQYGQRLRDLVVRSARAHVSHFKRWRKPKVIPQPAPGSSPADAKVLAVLGAEGAYLDWFRLPLAALCGRGLVLGLQNLGNPFLEGFCQLIEEGTEARTELLAGSERLTAGRFYFGNATDRSEFRFDEPSNAVTVKTLSSGELSWFDGVHLWLSQLGEQAQARMSVYFLSAAHQLASHLIQKLLFCQVKLIVPPPNTVMCTDLVDSILAYAEHYPRQVVVATPETLMEAW
jgi:two-component system chemotaxis response regulator CheB